LVRLGLLSALQLLAVLLWVCSPFSLCLQPYPGLSIEGLYCLLLVADLQPCYAIPGQSLAASWHSFTLPQRRGIASLVGLRRLRFKFLRWVPNRTAWSDHKVSRSAPYLHRFPFGKL
jgi:hypothetical protein